MDEQPQWIYYADPIMFTATIVNKREFRRNELQLIYLIAFLEIVLVFVAVFFLA